MCQNANPQQLKEKSTKLGKAKTTTTNIKWNNMMMMRGVRTIKTKRSKKTTKIQMKNNCYIFHKDFNNTNAAPATTAAITTKKLKQTATTL